MTVSEFLSSGIIETYCLGFTLPDDNILVEKMAASHPEVQAELELVRNSLHGILQTTSIRPRPSVKTAVMNAVYIQHAVDHPEYVPLLHNISDFETIYASVQANQLKAPTENFENLFAAELPSTNEIINFAVWVKKGHEEEMHTDRTEFIAVLEGSCEMFMEGRKTSYCKGQIITIPVNVPHHAVVTSEEPMFAFVQRQLIQS
ncbi:MAG: cupin domain-containing protein [Gloeobacteraceae cyanobacterium ES-bin-316]|nr:cupin domain-containing protein [Ferruginibacter sp.]